MSVSDGVRERILDAGLDLARVGSVGLGIEVQLPAAAERAGFSNATAYKIWGGGIRSADGAASDKFRRDLAAHALKQIRRHTFGDFEQHAKFIQSLNNPLSDTVRALSEVDLNMTEAHKKDMCISYALLGAAANDEGLRKVAAERYAHGQAEFASLFATVLTALGLQMREDYTVDHLALALGSLADGFILRSLLDGEAACTRVVRYTGRDGEPVDWYLYGCAAEGIVKAMTEPIAVVNAKPSKATRPRTRSTPVGRTSRWSQTFRPRMTLPFDMAAG